MSRNNDTLCFSYNLISAEPIRSGPLSAARRRTAITPQTSFRCIEATLFTAYEVNYFRVSLDLGAYEGYCSENLAATITQLEADMREAARNLQFERAAELRDRVKYLREREPTVT